MPTRTYVDFGYVEPAHAEIDARLGNWARWARNRAGSSASPMFRLYRAPQHWRHAVTTEAVDGIDAARVQAAVTRLPELHRLALSWAYIKRSNPAAMARQLGQTLQGLADLVRDGRQMLINRRA